MAIVEWKKDGTVAILTMNNGENRHNPDWTKAMLDAFKEIMADETIGAVVLTSSDPKNWCLGVDLAWMLPAKEKIGMPGISDWLKYNNEVFRFLIEAPIITIAAITGHAFGNGAMLSTACDFRFMRADKGFFCFPEVNIGIFFTPSMIEWCKRCIPYPKFMEMKYSGDKYGAPELEKFGIIRKACKDAEDTVAEAVAFGKTFTKKRAVLGEMKKRTHKHILDKMDNEDAAYLDPPINMWVGM